MPTIDVMIMAACAMTIVVEFFATPAVPAGTKSSEWI
jgi:hypothetical protein